MFIFNRVDYGTVQNFAKHFCGPDSLILDLARNGELFLEGSIRKELGVCYTNRMVFFEGVAHYSMTSLAKKLGIAQSTLHVHLIKNKRVLDDVAYSIDREMQAKITKSHNTQRMYNGVPYKTLKDMYAAYEISYQEAKFIAKNLKWTHEKVITEILKARAIGGN